MTSGSLRTPSPELPRPPPRSSPRFFCNGVLCPETFTASEQGDSVNKKLKTAAILTVQGPGRMTAKGRQQIATWLRNQASLLKVYGAAYTTGRYTAKWYYTEK